MRLFLAYLPFLAALAGSLHAGRPPVEGHAGGSLSFDSGRALRETRAVVGDGRPRVPGEEAHREARDLILERLSKLRSMETSTEEFSRGRERYVNVLGTLPGREEGRIYLGAHYDTRPPAPGAVDNASGVGILLEAARVLSEKEWDRTITFAFWDGEEAGLLGSRHHVLNLSPKQQRSVLAAISLDMPGWKGGSPVIHTFREAWFVDAPRIVPAWLPHLLLGAAGEVDEPLAIGDPRIPVHYQVGVRNLRIPFASDDGPFLEAGIPSVFIANSSFTRFFPHYHKKEDRMDEVGQEALASCGKTIVAAAAALASLPERPEAGPEGYLFIGASLLPSRVLALLAALALLPAALFGIQTRTRLDRAAAAGAFLLGGTVILFQGDPLLPVVSIPLILTLPILPDRSPWGVRLVALAGMLPGLSILFFLGLVKMNYGAHAPFLLSPLDWTVLAGAPAAYFAHAVRKERGAGRSKGGAPGAEDDAVGVSN